MAKTNIYLSYLCKDEKQKMTEAMPFLTKGGDAGKREFTDVANRLYGDSVQLNPLWDNGHYPSEWRAKGNGKTFYTIMQFEKRDLTEQALKAMGTTDSRNFPYYYAIMLCCEDRRLYLVTFSDKCSPNWNDDYDVERMYELQVVAFPILKEGCTIYRMEDSLHGAINKRLVDGHPLLVERDGEVRLTVMDQHGNYTEIVGETLGQVFRDYTDNYTGYRNYRRQMASEWEICDQDAKVRYEEWKKTAKGLKSDFDKFYGGGIVD